MRIAPRLAAHRMAPLAAAAAGLVAAAALASASLGAWGQDSAATGILVYFGTYTGEKSRGIYVSRLDAATGALSAPALAAETPNPSYLAIAPSGAYVYAANEVNTFEGKPTGSVSAFATDRKTGRLTPVNAQPSGGGGPAHLVTDRAGRHVLVANYGGGSVAVLPVEPRTGALAPPSDTEQHTGTGANPARQKAPHAHSVNLDPAERFAYVADLGIDKIMIYRFDGTAGALSPAEPAFAAAAPGAGPRHFAIHPEGRFAYAINELDCTITVYRVEARTGALDPVQTISTLPAGVAVEKGYSTADVQVHPSGRFLYGSNRGHDTMAVYAIDQATGRLTLVQHEPTGGSTPRAFGIAPGGDFLLAANQRSDSVVVFRVAPDTGRLTATGSRITVGSPVCVKFLQ